MDEMISYMCCNLRTAENSIKKIGKILKSHTRFNRICVIFAIAAGVYATNTKKRINEHSEKIKKLEKRVDELAVPDEALEKEFGITRGE